MAENSTCVKYWFEVHPFDTDAYSFQAHSSTQWHYVELTSNSSLNDVSLFIGSLLAFSELPFSSVFVDALYKEEELALNGGLFFEQNNLRIGASCCSDFQEWKLVADDVKRGVSPWIGHDPTPWFEFEGENIIVWSDEDDKENSYCIQLTQEEFAAQLEVAKQELQGFIKKVEIWTVENYQTDPSKLLKGINHYLFFKYK